MRRYRPCVCRGVTLVETLLYLALFSIVMSGLIVSAYGLFETSGRNRATASLQEEKAFLVARLNSAFDDAAAVSWPVAGRSDDVLVLSHHDGSSVSICVDEGALRELEDSGSCPDDGWVLSNANVVLTHLVFIHYRFFGSSAESIEAGFTISTQTENGTTIMQRASTTRFIHT